MADASVLGAGVRKDVGVRISPRPLIEFETIAIGRVIRPRKSLSRNGNSFDTGHRRGTYKDEIALPRVVPVETLWLGLVPICRPPKSATNPTVLPIDPERSPGRFTPAQGRDSRLRMQGLASAPMEAHSRRSSAETRRQLVRHAIISAGRRLGRLKRFDRKNRWRHHDRLAGTDVGGGRRAGSLWSIRRAQEPPVPDDLALDFSAAADGQTGEVNARLHTLHARKPPRSAERLRLRRRTRLPFFLQGNRLYWFLTILAATAVATMILGRMMIASGTGPGLTH